MGRTGREEAEGGCTWVGYEMGMAESNDGKVGMKGTRRGNWNRIGKG